MAATLEQPATRRTPKPRQWYSVKTTTSKRGITYTTFKPSGYISGVAHPNLARRRRKELQRELGISGKRARQLLRKAVKNG